MVPAGNGARVLQQAGQLKLVTFNGRVVKVKADLGAMASVDIVPEFMAGKSPERDRAPRGRGGPRPHLQSEVTPIISARMLGSQAPDRVRGLVGKLVDAVAEISSATSRTSLRMLHLLERADVNVPRNIVLINGTVVPVDKDGALLRSRCGGTITEFKVAQGRRLFTITGRGELGADLAARLQLHQQVGIVGELHMHKGGEGREHCLLSIMPITVDRWSEGEEDRVDAWMRLHELLLPVTVVRPCAM